MVFKAAVAPATTPTGAKAVLDAALGAVDLAGLRATVATKTSEWDTQQTELERLIGVVGIEQGKLDLAKKAEAAAILDCQLKAYDAYRTTLQAAYDKRNADLKLIKDLLKGQTVPAPGTKGARCEKALSNGTWRPARGAETCGEGLCCGAARVWMNAGAGTAGTNAAWRTVETCQTATDKTYSYQPPRAPLATTMPTPQTVDFTCIQGAKTLAAAASAVAAAVYMLA